ncbi:4815_t:CDS:1, partial [Ambispora leptoticha]
TPTSAEQQSNNNTLVIIAEILGTILAILTVVVTILTICYKRQRQRKRQYRAQLDIPPEGAQIAQGLPNNPLTQPIQSLSERNLEDLAKQLKTKGKQKA